MDRKTFNALDIRYTLVGSDGVRSTIKGRGPVSVHLGYSYVLQNEGEKAFTICMGLDGHMYKVLSRDPIELEAHPNLDFPRIDFPAGFNPRDNPIVAEYNGTLDDKGRTSMTHVCPADAAK